MDKNQKYPKGTMSEIENPKLTISFWRQLRWNLILFFVLLAVLPVAIAITITLYQANLQATEQVKNQLTSIAELKRGQIVRWLEDSQAVLRLFLADKNRADSLVNFLAFSSPEEESVTQNSLNNLLNEAVKAQPLFEEFFIYNTAGEILAASNPTELGKVVTRQPYFTPSLTGEYIQPPYYALTTAELAMLITHPLVDQKGQTGGVLAGRLNLSTLGQIMLERTGLSDSGETYLVSLESHYLVTPSRFESEGYIPTRAYYSDGINRALAGEDASGIYEGYREPPEVVIGAYRWIPELQVGLLAEVKEAEALAAYTRTQNLSVGIAVVAALVATGVGFYSATRISRPIATLTQMATRIAGGDLEQRAEITERNEIGLLATAFNTMTAQLRELIDSLEERVANRTQRLEIIASLNERLSAILDLEGLLVEMVNQVKEVFGYYHVHVYLLDEQRQRLVMTAGVGEAGARMKAAGHHIFLDTLTSLVAQAARTGEVVRVDNVQEAVDWLPNPLLPDTYAEMAVPISLEGQVVGVLDVQEDEVAGLDEGDANLLRSLASQVAVAMRNARLFAKVETALVQARAAQEKYVEQTWQKRKEKGQKLEHLHIRSVAAPALAEATLTEAKQLALGQNRPALVTLNETETNSTSIVAPVTLSGKTIGVLQAHRLNSMGGEGAETRPWTDEDLAVVETVLDQVAQAAENLRLFEETRERASREQTIREITDKLRTATSLEELVKITSRELGERLSAEHAVMELGLEPELNSTSASELAGNGQHKSKP